MLLLSFLQKMTIETNLEKIAAYANLHQSENDAFCDRLREVDNSQLDALVTKLNNIVTPKISCTECGNCCKSLMVNINEEEADNAAEYLKISRVEFDEKYIAKGESGAMIINSIPCHFLSDNKCSIYEKRFEGCKEFPALHLPNFNKRLFTVFMHYDRCPIIFNVIETLKTSLEFSASK